MSQPNPNLPEPVKPQQIMPNEYSQPIVQPNGSAWPAPGQTGNYPTQQPQYYSGPLPAYQQPQAQPPVYYQPQPQPVYYQPAPPPPAPVVNVVVQNTNVNQNVNRHYYYRRRRATHKGIGPINILYFLFIGWALGMTVAMFGLCVLPFSRSAGDAFMRSAFFLAFLA